MHLVMALPVRVAVVCGVMVTITSPWSHPGEEFVLLEALLENRWARSGLQGLLGSKFQNFDALSFCHCGTAYFFLSDSELEYLLLQVFPAQLSLLSCGSN